MWYFGLPELSQATFYQQLAGGAPGQLDATFLRTGDLGFVHEGQLYVTGRLKDLIISCGRNLYPTDLEETIRALGPPIRPGGGDNRGATLRLLGALPGSAFSYEASDLDLLLNTGQCFVARSATDALAWMAASPAQRAEIVSKEPHRGQNAWDMIRRIDCFTQPHYYSKTASLWQAENGSRYFARFRLTPPHAPADVGTVEPSDHGVDYHLQVQLHALSGKDLAAIRVASSEVGGKCASVTVDGHVFDLGGHVCTRHYTTVAHLVQEVGLAREEVTPSYRYDLATRTVVDPAADPGTLPALLSYKTNFQRDVAVALSSQGGAEVPGSMLVSAQEWLATNGLQALDPAIGPFFTGSGYGFLSNGQLPAASFLKFLHMVDLAETGPGHAQWTVRGGFGELWRRVAASLPDVRCGCQVNVIEKDGSGMLVRTNQGDILCDKLVVAVPEPAVVAAQLPASLKGPLEQVMGGLHSWPYYTIVATVTGPLPRLGFYMLDQHCRDSMLGHVVAYHHRYADSDVMLFYSYAADDQTAADIEALMQADVAAMGGKVEEVHLIRKWAYSPHASLAEQQAGFHAKLAALQGQNGICYVGGLLDFELVECTAAATRATIHRLYGKPAVTADVFLPTRAAANGRVLLDVVSAAFTSGRQQLDAHALWGTFDVLTRCGFAVVAVFPGSAPGVSAGQMIANIRAAMAWIRDPAVSAALGANPRTPLGLLGFSAGGLLALHSLIQPWQQELSAPSAGQQRGVQCEPAAALEVAALVMMCPYLPTLEQIADGWFDGDMDALATAAYFPADALGTAAALRHIERAGTVPGMLLASAARLWERSTDVAFALHYLAKAGVPDLTRHCRAQTTYLTALMEERPGGLSNYDDGAVGDADFTAVALFVCYATSIRPCPMDIRLLERCWVEELQAYRASWEMTGSSGQSATASPSFLCHVWDATLLASEASYEHKLVVWQRLLALLGGGECREIAHMSPFYMWEAIAYSVGQGLKHGFPGGGTRVHHHVVAEALARQRPCGGFASAWMAGREPCIEETGLALMMLNWALEWALSSMVTWLLVA
ncbi:hypothetical protein WJX72_009654 [[Myrmecia] bisecta]|uniref:Amine oxidase domain-containing protein n=1 Tax=[Myrmecia] bisecta TaxID=41462 RepID=A0AAW1Q7Y5_9CHLO